MAPDPEQLIRQLLVALEAITATQQSTLEAIKEQNARTLELAGDVADLGRRLRIAEVSIVGLVATIERESGELHDRITNVHQAAIKQLTRDAGRGTPA